MIEFIITSTLLIVLLFALKLIFNKAISRKMHYILWLLVAFRLMLPILPASDTSIMNFIDVTPAENYILGSTNIITAPPSTGTSLDTETPPIKQGFKLPINAIWVGGIFCMSAWFIIVNTKYALMLRNKRKSISTPDCRLPIYTVKGLHSPCLFGLLKPSIYIPEEISSDEISLKYIVMHELCHFRQLDHVWAVVRTVLLAVHWYNPFVWAAAISSREDCELACDELAVNGLNARARIEYGETLIGLATRKPGGILALSATSMNCKKYNLQRRIKALTVKSKHYLWVALIVAAAAVLIAGCTFTSAEKPNSDTLPGEDNSQSGSVYNTTQIEFYSDVNDIEPFIFSAAFPSAWEIRHASNIDETTYYSPYEIHDGDKLIGTLGYEAFEPYFEDIAPEDYYKAVYPSLRLGSMCIWKFADTPIKRDDLDETGIANFEVRTAEVEYLDPDEIDNHPGAMPEVPHIFTDGISAYSNTQKAYVLILFEPNAATAEQITAIAESIEIEAK